jgi:hypothetical protein
MEANMPDRQRLLELALKGLEAKRANIDDEIANYIVGRVIRSRKVAFAAVQTLRF